MTDPTGGKITASKNDAVIDETKLQFLMQNIRDNQNISLALIIGLAAAILGAIIWATITKVTGYQIGWMAVGIGFMVGYAIRFFGKGIDLSFQISGAILSLLGCLLGNLLTICIFVAEQEAIGLSDVLSMLDISITIDLLISSFQPTDALFYAIAVYEGYKFSHYKLSEEELAQVIKRQPTPAGESTVNKDTKQT